MTPTKPIRTRAAIERYLASLTQRHRLLDARIESESRFSSPRLKRLKRLRLALKDRIAALLRQERRQLA